MQIIRERLPDYPQRNGLIWNTSPGALLTLPTYTDSFRNMPYLLDMLGHQPGHNFTAVIFVQIGVTLTPNSALYRLVKSITKSQFVDRVSIVIHPYRDSLFCDEFYFFSPFFSWIDNYIVGIGSPNTVEKTMA